MVVMRYVFSRPVGLVDATVRQCATVSDRIRVCPTKPVGGLCPMPQLDLMVGIMSLSERKAPTCIFLFSLWSQ
jgi:hypothetical protein